MIAAVSTVRNEADIIQITIRHLLAEGIDAIYIADASTDETTELLDQLPVTVIRDEEPFHYQPAWIDRLAEEAAHNGAEWIIPFDADEFWYATSGETIRFTLDGLGPEIHKLHARAFQHRDWDHREVEYRSMGKIAYRWEPGCCIANGNHDVWLPSGGFAMSGVLDLREWQFRSFAHMRTKCHDRTMRIDPQYPYTTGMHQRVLDEMTLEQLKAEWDRKQAVPVVFDPIPTRVSV